ncbi:hypothetical protein SAY87_027661 [Trapa incisa]|uniref:WAT1-related protein n=1 Tax=Trapa incisa TaxID=236973 RepID=A0AAN7PIF7_9MYRT|nr:hypothetical protein SAY87_027661 [Trapa incisa]
MEAKKLGDTLTRAKPFLAVIFIQFGFAGMTVITKFALDKGMDQHVFVVYRHLVATLVIAPFALVFERKRRPKMTISIFIKIAILGLLEPVIDQNLYYTGMKLTSATFTSAMCNVLPAFAFILAWIFRLEKVKLKKIHSQAKIVGTIVTVGGAMLMTLVKGAVINLPWAHQSGASSSAAAAAASSAKQDPIKGAIMIMSGCFCWASFVILQAMTLKAYPVELSLTALICLMGCLEGAVFAVAFEGGFRGSSWAIHFDAILVSIVYSGIICSGVQYYLQGVVMKSRGPVFITAFNPLSMVIVAILGSFILHEILTVGRIIGALVIVTGLYMVLWGKSKDEIESPSDNGGSSHKVASAETDLEAIPVSMPGSIEVASYMAVDVTSKVKPAAHHGAV